MTNKHLEDALKNTLAYKANESAIKASEAAYRVQEAATEAWSASLLTKFETMWALGATEEYQAWKESTE